MKMTPLNIDPILITILKMVLAKDEKIITYLSEFEKRIEFVAFYDYLNIFWGNNFCREDFSLDIFCFCPQ